MKNKINSLFIGAFSIGVLLSMQNTFAEQNEVQHVKIFKCTNQQGEVYYNDKPCPVDDDEKKMRSEKDVANGYTPPDFQKEAVERRKGVVVGGSANRSISISPFPDDKSSYSQGGGASGPSASKDSKAPSNGMGGDISSLEKNPSSLPEPRIAKSAPGEKFTIQEKKLMLGVSPEIK